MASHSWWRPTDVDGRGGGVVRQAPGECHGPPGLGRCGAILRPRAAPRGRPGERGGCGGVRSEDLVHDVRARGVSARGAAARDHAPGAAGRALRGVAPRGARGAGEATGGGAEGEGDRRGGGEESGETGGDAAHRDGHIAAVHVEARAALARGDPGAAAGVETGGSAAPGRAEAQGRRRGSEGVGWQEASRGDDARGAGGGDGAAQGAQTGQAGDAEGAVREDRPALGLGRVRGGVRVGLLIGQRLVD